MISKPIEFITRGSLIRLKARPEVTGAVVDVMAGDPETRFVVFHGGEMATYYASQVEPLEDAPSRSILDADALHAALTALQLRHPSTQHLYSLHASRINFVPYQYRPVLKLIRADRPRLLVADEVGVGKTIEAGLILKELQARRDLKSVLVICPKPLVAEGKWREELKRFDEQFTHLDGDTLRYCVQETHLDGAWPPQHARAIVPFSLFDEALLLGRPGKSKGLLDLDPPPAFDLVIVDEAHHIRNTDTWAHRTTRFFCEHAEAVVLLSATPIQLGDQDLFHLLQLVRPDLLLDRRDFELMSGPNPFLNAAVEVLRGAAPGCAAWAREEVQKALATPWGSAVLAPTPGAQLVQEVLEQEDLPDTDRLKVVRGLEDLHTFSAFINRTRRRDIGSFTTRKPETCAIEFTPEQAELYRRVLALVARILAKRHGDRNLQFMMSTLRRQVASCVYGLAPFLKAILAGQISRLELSEAGAEDDGFAVAELLDAFKAEIQEVVALAGRLNPHDPKFSAFARVVRDKQALANNKLLVFSTFRHTLAYLESKLRDEEVRLGVIHGDVPEEERRALRNRFSRPKEDPAALDVLLSSEVGCEGLDYQFCDGLVNYDLPWNPMRVEQRIGRIDRYGQRSETVVIVNLITPGTVDAEIYERCLLRIGVFRQALGGSEEILGRLTQQIRSIAENFELTLEEQGQRLQQLADNEIRLVQEQALLEDQQAGLFGLSVPVQDSDMIKGASSFWLTPERIRNLCVRYLSGLVGEAGASAPLAGEEPIYTLQADGELRRRLLEDHRTVLQAGAADKAWERWLKGHAPELMLTFAPEVAERERALMFITPAHPLARQAAKVGHPSAPAVCALSVRSDDLPVGRYPFALYRWKQLGLAESFSLQAVCEDAAIEKVLLELLDRAVASSESAAIPSSAEARLEAQHYRHWQSHREAHVRAECRLAEARLASLSATHAARMALLEEQRDQVVDPRIRRMKEGQIVAAERDFQRRRLDMEQVAGRADIVADLVVSGTLDVMRPE